LFPTKQSYGAFEEMKKGHGVMKKGHDAAPFYFSLDKTLVNKHVRSSLMPKPNEILQQVYKMFHPP
jgi:hypothetical protein